MIDPSSLGGGGELLGKGSFGAVYKCEWNTDVVAVKILLGDADLEARSAFEEELQILLQLRSPRVLQTFGGCVNALGRQGTMIVMEYAPGGTLYDLLRRESLEQSSRLRLATEITAGVQYLHTNNVIHRDLKSLTVLIDAHNGAKQCDFWAGEGEETLEVLNNTVRTRITVMDGA